MTDLADQLIALFERRGADAYSGEAVTQEAHALQSAALAEAEGAAEPLVIAALLHDIGHLIHGAKDAAARGVDARHEAIGAVRLALHFGPEVVEPVTCVDPPADEPPESLRSCHATNPATNASATAAPAPARASVRNRRG